MIDLLERAASRDAEAIAVVTYDSNQTYGKLFHQATSVAAALSDLGITRFAIVDHEASTVITLLAGACLAGAEACQYPPTEAAEIAELASRFGHQVIVSDRQDLILDGITVLHPSTLTSHAPAEATPEPGARPLLLLTTGTTGQPRGVVHDWRRLTSVAERVKPAPGERWLLAYGLHQFAGLQVLLHVLAAQATLVAPAPRRPSEGLAAMRQLGVTHASATPTYWRFLLAELASDGGPTPSLHQVTLGGEAVPDSLLHQLRKEFPQARVSQVYAASEFGATGSMRDGRSGLSTDVLGRGEGAPVDMRVENGELWIRSRHGMVGYYGEAPVDPDAWRPTGDVVEIVGDRIEFRGRVSEIINVGGIKVHPLPIEERVSSVPSVAVARVWGRPNAMTGTIVAVDVVIASGADPDRVKHDVRAACADLPPEARPRAIKVVTDIVTRGHKIVRRDAT